MRVKKIKRIALLPIALLLMGAAGPVGCTPNLSPAGLHAICNALVGPIRYNTYNRASGRYAGPILGLDLKQRNQIGQRLGCPQFRVT
jgi:hypothetical protein